MPPRPRQDDIAFAVQTDGVTPVMPVNLDKHCPVVVSRAAYRWRALLPFLPWVDELVAPGLSPSSATISYFELEALLLIVLDFQTGAEDKQPIDTYLKLDFMARVLRHIATANIINVPVKDEAAFYNTVFPYVQGLQSPENNFLQVTAGALRDFTPRLAPYTDDREWLQSLTWRKLKSSRGSYAEARWFLRFLGDRATLESRQNPDLRLVLVARQIFAGWASVFEDFSFTPAVSSGLMATWFTSLKWPMSLNAPMPELTDAITDFLRMYRFETTDTSSKSLLVAEVFDRVLQQCPQLQLIAGDAHAMDAFNAFRPMLASYDISRHPLLEDWQALDLALVPMKDMLMDVGSGANKLMSKVQLVIEDKRKEQAVSVMSTEVPAQQPGVARRGRVSAASLNILRRDPMLLQVVQALKAELDRPEGTRRSHILSICLRSKLSGVVRYITGALDTLEVADVFASLTHLRIRKLADDSLAPLCDHLWAAVFAEEIANNDLVGNASFSPAFIKAVFSSKWDAIDWEQRLVHDLDLAKSGVQYEANKSRAKALWFTTEHSLTDLMSPMQRFFSELGYGGAEEENSCAALLGATLLGYQEARRQPVTSKSVFNRSREAWFQALKEANQTFSDFYDDSSAVAPFPDHWLKLESKCLDRVDSTKRAAQTFMRWKADLGEVMDAMQPAAQPAATPAKRNNTDTQEESERLRKQIKSLQNDLKTAKAVIGPSLSLM